MKKPTIVIVSNHDDWEAVYADGKKIDEGHRCRLSEVLTKLGFSVETKEVSPELEMDAFPPTL